MSHKMCTSAFVFASLNSALEFNRFDDQFAFTLQITNVIEVIHPKIMANTIFDSILEMRVMFFEYGIVLNNITADRCRSDLYTQLPNMFYMTHCVAFFAIFVDVFFVLPHSNQIRFVQTQITIANQ